MRRCIGPCPVRHGPKMINLTASRYFLEVVHLGSIRLAADRLHVSPSAISRQIAKLEREFGETLLDRRSNGVELTAAGKIAADHFGSIIDQVDLIKGEISDLRKLKSGSVSMATVDGISDPTCRNRSWPFARSFPPSISVYASAVASVCLRRWKSMSANWALSTTTFRIR